METWKKGDRIRGRYEVLKVLAGGMGNVYLSYDHEHREAVAIKTFHDKYVADNRAVARFIREAEIWVKLEKHRNIVRAKYATEIQGKPHIVLEYIAGGDLRDYMKARRLSIPTILELAMDFCRGMHFAHSNLGIVHRDIKPENCMLTSDRVLKITDFGIAAIQGEVIRQGEGIQNIKTENLTSTDSFMGTIPYASPEQFMDLKLMDTRSDIYSFGSMIYEMLTGKTPFGSDDINACISGHLFHEPPDPRAQWDETPEELSAVVLRCLAKTKEERFSSFGELGEALQKIYRSVTGFLYPEPEEDRALTAWELLNKGASLSSLGMDTEAIAYFDQALKRNPRYDRAWFNKGASLFALGRTEEAVRCNEQALKLNPRLAEAWSNKGVSLSALGKKNEALKCFDRALTLNHLHDDALINKGLALQALGKHEEALQSFDRALVTSPCYAKAWSYKGISTAAIRTEGEALHCCDKALEMNPHDGELWYNRGLVLSLLGRNEKALEDFDRAIELNPASAEAWHHKGRSLSILSLDNDALPCYARALELAPRHAEAWADKGLSYAVLGNYEQAIYCYDRALEIEPRGAGALANKVFPLVALGREKEASKCLRELRKLNAHLADQVKAQTGINQ
ncbi:MAG: serine/threonine-protein kinase [Candidatus Eremiobacteraeota bacterium]|nr:serine/threonine-protein kinase [Candidatus Eremiobacteraeota bacterium]